MKAKTIFLKDLLSQTMLLRVPAYQRRYTWEESHCLTLLHDIETIANSSEDSYYLFNSYFIENKINNKMTEWLIIDGQQRLTTCYLLLAALKARADEMGLVNCAESINKKYLINPEETSNNYYKLCTANNYRIIQSLVGYTAGKYVANKTDLMVINFNLFYEYIKDVPTYYTLMKGFEKLTITQNIIDTTIEDPLKIFERLNATGKPLDIYELIHSNFFVRFPTYDLQRFYNTQFWEDMVDKIGENYKEQFMTFLNQYFLYEHSKLSLSDSHLADNIKIVLSNPPNNIDLLTHSINIITDMHQKCVGWLEIVNGTYSKDRLVEHAIKRIRSITEDLYPIYKLVDLYETEGLLTRQFLLAILESIINYKIRTLCIEKNTDLNFTSGSVLHTVYKKFIKSKVYTQKNWIELLTSSTSYPNDAQIRTLLPTINFYRLKSATFILTELDNYNVATPTLYTNPQKEHIFPKTTSAKDKQNYSHWTSADWAELDLLKNSIGNITLLNAATNSKFSNETFLVKKNFTDAKGVKIGFAFTTNWLNEDLRNKSEFITKDIKERGIKLTERLLEVFRDLTPETVKKTIEQEEGFIYFDEYWGETTRTLPKITGVKINGLMIEEVPQTHSDLFIRIIKELYNNYEDYFNADLLKIAGISTNKQKGEFFKEGLFLIIPTSNLKKQRTIMNLILALNIYEDFKIKLIA